MKEFCDKKECEYWKRDVNNNCSVMREISLCNRLNLKEKEAPVSVPFNEVLCATSFMEECYKKFIRKAKENNRTLQPWKDEPRNFLRDRLEEEKEELFDAMFDGDHEAIMDECLDVANFAWFIYQQTKAGSETGA